MLNSTFFSLFTEILLQSQLLKEANLKGPHNLKIYLQKCIVASVTDYQKLSSIKQLIFIILLYYTSEVKHWSLGEN